MYDLKTFPVALSDGVMEFVTSQRGGKLLVLRTLVTEGNTCDSVSVSGSLCLCLSLFISLSVSVSVCLSLSLSLTHTHARTHIHTHTHTGTRTHARTQRVNTHKHQKSYVRCEEKSRFRNAFCKSVKHYTGSHYEVPL